MGRHRLFAQADGVSPIGPSAVPRSRSSRKKQRGDRRKLAVEATTPWRQLCSDSSTCLVASGCRRAPPSPSSRADAATSRRQSTDHRINKQREEIVVDCFFRKPASKEERSDQHRDYLPGVVTVRLVSSPGPLKYGRQRRHEPSMKRALDFSNFLISFGGIDNGRIDRTPIRIFQLYDHS